jgi:formylglycine-generating enzyme required for sulfatase activity
VLRGGSFATPQIFLSCTVRDRDLATATGDAYGLRVVEVV